MEGGSVCIFICIAIVMKLLIKRRVCALCTFLFGKVIPEFHLHIVLIDTVCYAYCGDALKCVAATQLP